MTPAAARRGAGRRLPVFALSLLLAIPACARVPKIIVLEDPLTAEEHVTLGVAYERKGELEPAAREYGRALKKAPGLFRARLNLGNVRLAQERYGEARTEYLAALALRPDDPEATNNLAWVAIRSGSERGDALRRMEAVLAGPGAGSPPLLDTYGVLLGELSRTADAERAFAEAERMCSSGNPACTETVRAEIREHREANRKRSPPPVEGSPLVK